MAPRVLFVEDAVALDDVEVAVVNDGDEAVRHIEAQPFDAVVIDLGRPALDGWLVLARLGVRRPRPTMIVVLGEPEDAGRAVALGADVCVAGTADVARVLDLVFDQKPAEEIQCPAFPTTSFPAPTTSGASV